MAEELKDALGVDLELIEGRGGEFEVKRDGSLVFSKRELGRFPEDGEVVQLLKA